MEYIFGSCLALFNDDNFGYKRTQTVTILLKYLITKKFDHQIWRHTVQSSYVNMAKNLIRLKFGVWGGASDEKPTKFEHLIPKWSTFLALVWLFSPMIWI